MGQEDETMMMMMRKGPWTEQEDVQLVSFVNMFGDRRWDFIAKVSGLKRSGKSCRLRWVNYLHPGLKRGKMTPQEERRILELHSKWGNRWSRIARKLPGRTDNEIKNYWRTHMRKKAQEMKRALPPSPSVTSNSSNSYSSISTTQVPFTETNERSFYDTGGLEEMVQAFTKSKSNTDILMKSSSSATSVNSFISEEQYSMADVWKDLLEDDQADIRRSCVFGNYYSEEIAAAPSPIWDYSLWMINDGQEEMIVGNNIFFPDNKRVINLAQV